MKEVIDRYRLPAEDSRSSGRRTLRSSDALVITYADQIRAPGEYPLVTLRRFMSDYAPFISNLHLLPFYPFTSDDGFGVVDYLAVRDDVGSWQDIEGLADDVSLMFDAVINHVSASSPWIQGFLDGDARFADFAIDVDPEADLSQVVRPRTSPLLTRFMGSKGPRWLWTTFSDDQVDLNYANPQVLLAVLDVLCRYVHHGASWLRLDAVSYLWKRIGTTSCNLPETHNVIKLIRAALDEVAPGTVIVTETNVPHDQNVSFFGDGVDEAQLVYNFALPPLVLHTLRTGEPEVFLDWLRELRAVGPNSTFLNFLASHDGIGMRGAENILSDEHRTALAAQVQRHGGYVSYRSMSDGGTAPYELNIAFIDALSDPASNEPVSRHIDRFICATSLMMAIPGVPAIYLHSLLGSRSDRAGAEELGYPRAINRATLDLEALEAELGDARSIRRRVLEATRALVTTRGEHDAFDPAASCVGSEPVPGVIQIMRKGVSGTVACLHNVRDQHTTVPLEGLFDGGVDLITAGTVIEEVELPPYGVRWVATR
ncbi:alpha-amylase family glycosyl hydrolase [Nesterenkonia salmonea]|uniref:alpha-amylase family glycosyl hydrolase n=1 Tax=Nesterenkonia salmonea TaxID=1804987 RepID=UPI0014076E1A|nr:alpha-amylase family glycosyl hydrolase [Nesterenkonia salmonea]